MATVPDPYNSNLRKAVKIAGKKLRKVSKAGVLNVLWDFVRILKTRAREGDQAGIRKDIKTINVERKRNRSSVYVKD